jgi:hypothetical protein
MQLTNMPPLPFLPNYLPAGTPVYLLSTNGTNLPSYVYDDMSIDYAAEAEAQSLLNQLAVNYPPPPGPPYGGSDTNIYPPGPLGMKWDTNDLRLELIAVTNDLAYLVLHGTKQGYSYQLLSKEQLTDSSWQPGQIVQDTAGTNGISFAPVPGRYLQSTFFRASGPATTTALIVRPGFYPDPAEPQTPDGQPTIGVFWVETTTFVQSNLTIFYRVGGSASNGIDYTNLTGQITVPASSDVAALIIHPYYDNLLEFDESVIITLLPGPGYVIDPANASARMYIVDNPGTNVVYQTAFSNQPYPIDIEYHAPQGTLVLSLNYSGGEPNNFGMLRSTGGSRPFVWSTINGIPDEVKFAAAKQTAGGINAGEILYASKLATSYPTTIGRLSADGTQANDTWVTLPGETDFLRGGICIDEAGAWGGDIIAVTGDEYPLSGSRGVWRVSSTGIPTLVTRIATRHLEGVLTVSNDRQKWGPLAGKILTGDERAQTLFAIDTNAVVLALPIGIDPEDFHIVPTNQSLYCVNYNANQSALLRIQRNLLVGHEGEIIITQSGEITPDRPANFLLRWDGNDLVTWRINLPTTFPGTFEHVAFVPPPF